MRGGPGDLIRQVRYRSQRGSDMAIDPCIVAPGRPHRGAIEHIDDMTAPQ
jgi:hypothetical protein